MNAPEYPGPPWVKLNPALADYRAVYGLRGPKGSTFLITEDSRLVAVGLWSGLWPASAETMQKEIESLRRCAPGMTDIDRRISPAKFKEWQEVTQ